MLLVWSLFWGGWSHLGLGFWPLLFFRFSPFWSAFWRLGVNTRCLFPSSLRVDAGPVRLYFLILLCPAAGVFVFRFMAYDFEPICTWSMPYLIVRPFIVAVCSRGRRFFRLPTRPGPDYFPAFILSSQFKECTVFSSTRCESSIFLMVCIRSLRRLYST